MRRRSSAMDVIIVGAGASGLSAAQHCALQGLRTLVIESQFAGGLIVNVGVLDGYPGALGISGAGFASAMQSELQELGIEIVTGEVSEIVPGPRLWTVKVAQRVYQTSNVVCATGAQLAPLPVPGFARLLGRGVSQCAYCDAGLYRDERVVVVGGGDAALQEALHLTDYASEVILVHRTKRLRARHDYVTRAGSSANLQFRWSSEVVEILGDSGVEGVCVRNIEREDNDTISCRAVFPFVGLQPRTDVFAAHVVRDERGAITANDSLMANAQGVFVVGAARAGYEGLVVDAVSDGARAARSIARRRGGA
ncbi:MAG: thioredoxin reductase (NADPH) [Gammaproteobacteria bacterium]|jgi:thioredoxin reductase (NADPH)